MGKVLKNLKAFVNGIIKKYIFVFLNKNIRIGFKVRIFSNTDLKFYRGSNVVILNNVKIDSGAEISAKKGADLFIGNNVGIGKNNLIVCHDKIEIGEGTILAPFVLIYDHDHVFSSNGIDKKSYKTASVVIGKNCWIGANTVILRGTTIGDNCVIGAGSVIKGIYPSGSLIVQKRENIVREVRE